MPPVGARHRFTRTEMVLGLDVVLAVFVVLVGAAVASSPGVAWGWELLTIHLLVTVVTALVFGGVVMLGVIGARALRHPRPAWLGAAFALDGLFAIPLAALGPLTLAQFPGFAVTMVAANLLAALLLVFLVHPPRGGGTWLAGTAAVLGAALAVAVGVLAPGLVDARGVLALEVVPSIAWLAAGTAGMAVGWRDRDTATWRVGIGLSVIGLAHAYGVVTHQGPTAVGLGFTALQLIGGIGVLGGLVHRLRGEVITLFSQADRMQTELREAAEHIRRAAELARERDHELANGLAGLSGVAFLLDDPAARDDTPALRSAVVSELSRLHTVLDRAGDEDPAAHDFDVAGLLAEVTMLHRGRGIDIQVSADGGTCVHGDRSAVGQVLTNLLVNCERHAPGSPVRVQVSGAAEQVAVVVEDDGPGLADGAEQHVLERGVAAPQSAGSGLGLHVSARLMAEQQGSLQVLPRHPDRDGFAVRLALRTGVDCAA